MPRPLAYGDGVLLVQVDPFGTIRDLCYPLGVHNHLCGRAIQVGVHVEDALHWLHSPAWERAMRYVSVDPLVGETVYRSAELGLEVTTQECVTMGGFMRKMSFRNLRDEPRTIRLFVNEQLHLCESDIGDCCLWHEEHGGILHYKADNAFLILLDPKPDQYACGYIGFGGYAGTSCDAEDGELSMEPIQQGAVDATLRSSLHLEALGDAEATLSLIPCMSPPEDIRRPHLPETFKPFDRETLNLAIMETQVADSGAVIAANDSDIMATNRANYGYCWPRDAAHVAEVFLDHGRLLPAERFLSFAATLLQHRPYVFQKYLANGALGAGWHPWSIDGHPILPIQQDETASIVSLACRMAKMGRSDSGIPLSTRGEGDWGWGVSEANHEREAPPFLNIDLDTLIRKPANFFLEYRSDDGLPMPSFDLWEERRGVHAYTVATVIRALRDASEVFHAAFYAKVAEDMLAAFLAKFVLPEGYFARRLDPEGHPDPTVDSSTLWIGLLGVLPIDHALVKSNANVVEHRLWTPGPVGGLARYENDYYFRRSHHHTGNPWIISTLWLAQHKLLSGDRPAAERLVEWVERHAHPTGVLPEQIDPETGEHLSVSPLTWSHAEYARTLHMLNRT